MAAPDPAVARALTTRYWRAYTADHDEADAAARFLARYAEPPEYIVEVAGLLLVGPIPEGAPDGSRSPANPH